MNDIIASRFPSASCAQHGPITGDSYTSMLMDGRDTAFCPDCGQQVDVVQVEPLDEKLSQAAYDELVSIISTPGPMRNVFHSLMDGWADFYGMDPSTPRAMTKQGMHVCHLAIAAGLFEPCPRTGGTIVWRGTPAGITLADEYPVHERSNRDTISSDDLTR